jgi:hypothetical protein
MISGIAPWRTLESLIAKLSRDWSKHSVSTERAQDKRGAASGPQAVVSLRGFARHTQPECRKNSSRTLIFQYFLYSSIFGERARA